MRKNHLTLVGILVSMALLFIATTQYPGGSQHDAQSIGFSWRQNYLSNLLNPLAVNGAVNAARPWAVAGVLFLCASAAWTFVRLAAKIQHKTSANIIRYAGVGAVLVGPLAATPLHDLVMIVSGTLLMLSLFYATVLSFKTKHNGLKALSVLLMLALYSTAFVYYTQIGLPYLPILQKLWLVLAISWLLAMEYGVKSGDFDLG